MNSESQPKQYSRRNFLKTASRLAAAGVAAATFGLDVNSAQASGQTDGRSPRIVEPEITTPPGIQGNEGDRPLESGIPVRLINVVNWEPGNSPDVVEKSQDDLATPYFSGVEKDVNSAIAAVRAQLERMDLQKKIPDLSMDVIVQGGKDKTTSLVTPTPSSELKIPPAILVTTTGFAFSWQDGKLWSSDNADALTLMDVYDAKAQKVLAQLPEGTTTVPKEDKLYLIDGSGTILAVGSTSTIPVKDGDPGKIQWEERKVWDEKTNAYVERVTSFTQMTPEALQKVGKDLVAGTEMEIKGKKWQIVTDVDQYKDLFSSHFDPYLFARYLDKLQDYVPYGDAYRVKIGDIVKNPGYAKNSREITSDKNKKDVMALLIPDQMSEPGLTKFEVDIDTSFFDSQNVLGTTVKTGKVDAADSYLSTEFLGELIVNTPRQGGAREFVGSVVGVPYSVIFTYYLSQKQASAK